MLRYGASAKPEKVEDAIEVLAKTSDLMSEALDQFLGNSMLILPVTPFPTPDISATNEDLATSADFTCLANICDLPAISIPAPGQAIQLMAKNGDDYRLLNMAKTIYKILG